MQGNDSCFFATARRNRLGVLFPKTSCLQSEGRVSLSDSDAECAAADDSAENIDVLEDDDDADHVTTLTVDADDADRDDADRARPMSAFHGEDIQTNNRFYS